MTKTELFEHCKKLLADEISAKFNNNFGIPLEEIDSIKPIAESAAIWLKGLAESQIPDYETTFDVVPGDEPGTVQIIFHTNNPFIIESLRAAGKDSNVPANAADNNVGRMKQ